MARDQDLDQKLDALFGTPETQSFSYHNTTYFIFGVEDLKLQFSFKYRLAKSVPVYFAYTQLMFWEIYDQSKPFGDVNYRPEVFYRWVESESSSFKTIDTGYMHTSNGEDKDDSRSLDRIFVRTNYLTKFKRHLVNTNLMVFGIFNQDKENNGDIVNHIGYWDLTMVFTDLVVVNEQSLALEFRAYAGSKIIDFDQGATQVGLIYDFKSDGFNPSIYFQWFEGYGESLIDYNKRNTAYRLGLMLTF